MDSSDADVAQHARAFHDEIPHEFQVSLSMSVHTRELLRTIRDDLNDQAGEPVLNTNDVVQLALLGAARYYDTTADAGRDPADDDGTDSLPTPEGPLLPSLYEAVVADDDVSL
jgi:hypothetical protein